MRINKKYNKPNRLWKILLAVLVVAGVGSAVFAYMSKGPASNLPVEPAPEKLSEEDANAKQEFLENSNKDGAGVEGREGVVENSSVDVETSIEGETVVIRTKLFDVSSGMCKLSIKNGAEAIERSAEVIYQDEYSTCAGFSISKQSLGAGNWNIKVEVSNEGMTKTGNATLEVV